MAYHNDEGFSEEVRMADDAMDNALVPGVSPLPDCVQTMSQAQRSELAHAILRSLPTSAIQLIVDQLNPLLHIDPILRLPPEIALEVMAYLDVSTLLTTTILSKSWRMQALDPHLWKHLFAAEGWKADYRRIWDFEEAQREREAEKLRERNARIRPADAVSDSESKSPKKRVRDINQGNPEEDDSYMAVDTDTQPRWAEQHGHVEADEDEKMDDAMPEHRKQPVSEEEPLDRVSFLQRSSSSQKDMIYPPIKPSLLTADFSSSAQINWQYLYKQKRRLEENWKAGRFTNFTLPHPSHPHEAHVECIYTIQYIGNNLVSGSRDRTIRVWNLDTQRLSLPPLRGHEASVLCLQFDSAPSEDIIISGGSDWHVIIWQFSTGKILKKIERAHSESVLNLKFDKRHLVTCSKDRTIKVWNRKDLLPTDDNYPVRGSSSSARWPSHIIDISAEFSRQALRADPLPAYSLLVTLAGHTAAVNAIQVLDNTIVSASGDRNIKIWDMKTGLCMKTVYGHSKGIACVQFDGRRIVSGSSDETVRIFDASKAGEVACLRGHAQLVRTVQARFGDIPSNVKEEEAQARAFDQKVLHAIEADKNASKELTREQLRAKNAGNRDIADIYTLGAKLPPGGGGSQWARIVSGSYDETIIIWTRDGKGKWIPHHQLTQWEAILRAGGQPRIMPQNPPFPPASQIANTEDRRRASRHRATQHYQQRLQQMQSHQQRQLLQQQQQLQQQGGSIDTNTLARRVAMSAIAGAINPAMANGQSTNSQDLQTQAVAPHVRQMQQQSSAPTQQRQPTTNDTSQTPQPIPHRTVQAQSQTQTQSQSQSQSQSQASNQSQTQAQPQPAVQPQGQSQPGTAPQSQAQTQPSTHRPAQGTNPATTTQATNPGQAPNPATAAQQDQGQHNQRIYKLQFCSRRLLCCSVEPIIVGWDFANGDKEIEVASEFFGEDFC